MSTDLRFEARIVRPEPSEPYVGLPVVSGGLTAGDAIHDTALLFVEDGRYEDAMIRVFGEGCTVELRFNTTTMREALNMLDELRHPMNERQRTR